MKYYKSQQFKSERSCPIQTVKISNKDFAWECIVSIMECIELCRKMFLNVHSISNF